MTTDEEASSQSTKDISKPGASDQVKVSLVPTVMEPSSSASNPSIDTSDPDSTGNIQSKESNKRTKTESTDPVTGSKGDGEEGQDAKPSNEMNLVEEKPSDELNLVEEKPSNELNLVEEKPSNEMNLVEDTVGEVIEFNVVYMKKSHKISMKSSETIGHLKSHLESLLGVVGATAKLLYKVAASDESTLESWGLKNGSKVILMGTKSSELVHVPVPPSTSSLPDEVVETPASEPLCRQKPHCKVIEKGKPEDAMVGMRNIKAPLPREPLSGMVNRYGGKVRLTFKLELDQVWIGTKERTEKVNMQTIRSIVSEPIQGHEEYHIMGIQLGSTAQSRYWVYWVPAQYVDAIKDAIGV